MSLSPVRLRTVRSGAGAHSGHPEWCAEGHHCTAGVLASGEHASIPEVWETDVGRVVATRYRSRDGHRDHVEVRVSVALHPDDNDAAESGARAVIASIYATLLNLSAMEERARP